MNLPWKKNVAIFGGGIAGLTVAHQLIKLGYKVAIYERLDTIGGMARSSRDKDGCATEYSWRVYFWFYYNLFSMLREIPLSTIKYNENNNSKELIFSKSHVVIDNLIPYASEMFPQTLKQNTIDYYKSALNLAKNMLKFSSTADKNLKKYDELSWYNELHNNNNNNNHNNNNNNSNNHSNNKNHIQYAWDPIPQSFGLDQYKASYYSVMKSAMETIGLHPFQTNYVLNQPTS